MSEYFEIAYAALTHRLCFFTGTGFSKAVSDGEAPTWRGLLEGLCAECESPKAVTNALFPKNGSTLLALEESAQVISIELLKSGKNISSETAKIISSVDLGKNIKSIKKFCRAHVFKVITTNYDKLMEEICGEEDCQSLTPGLPIPRSSARVRVYHVHGSIDVPENMIITSDHYFKFMNNESYFSRKLSTILHENTVVILGYALGDANLKAILSDYQGFARSHSIGSNIFLVSRGAVIQHIKDYYSNCYGIRVIDETEIEDFFEQLNRSITPAKQFVERSVKNIRKVIFENHYFTAKYVQLEESFYEIVSSVSAIGLTLNDPRVVEVFGKVIQKKSELSSESGAWEQYTHLARWLIYLGAILNIRETSIEKIYLKAVKRSMETMSKELKYGYSWQSYNIWKAKWGTITPDNRKIIRDYITEKSISDDAQSIVNL